MDENTAAAEVGSTDELIATNKRNVSSPASKFASATKNDDQFKAIGDGLVSGGSGPGGWFGQDNAHGQGMADVRIVGVTGMFSGFSFAILLALIVSSASLVDLFGWVSVDIK